MADCRGAIQRPRDRLRSVSGRSSVADCAAWSRSEPGARVESGRTEWRSAARSARRAEDSRWRDPTVARAAAQIGAAGGIGWSAINMASVTLRAFAKINLSLRVFAARPDGFHEVRTILQAIDLFDRVRCVARRGPFQIRCDTPGVPVDRTNLVWKAAQLLWQAAGDRKSVVQGKSVDSGGRRKYRK